MTRMLPQSHIYTINSMGQDGDTVVAMRIESRDIEIVSSINERDKDAAYALRRSLYHTMNSQLKATLTYARGDIIRVIDCVPDNAPVFSRRAVLIDYTVQLKCPYPFWRDITETQDDIAAWVGDFQFPVEIPIETGMQFGHREPSLIVNVRNGGDVRAGMKVDFKAIGTVVNPSLLNIETLEFIKINYTMQSGEIIRVSTLYGQKSVTLIRGNSETDAFQYLDPDSIYIQLEV